MKDSNTRMPNRDSNIFEELGFAKIYAANLKIRAELILQLREYLRQQGFTQREAAERLGITQPDVSSIIHGKISKFTIDKLVNLLARTGHNIEISSNKRAAIHDN